MDTSVLHSDGELTITLTIDDGGGASLEVAASKRGPDLSREDDVVVIVSGQGVPLTFHDRRRVTADLGDWEARASKGFDLAVRVDEFFEHWDFLAEDDAES